MKLSKKEELLALGSALYLLGFEIEGNRAKLQKIVDQHMGVKNIPVTQELMNSILAFENAQHKFAQLEEKYIRLRKDLQT